ncbi:uncharacterized protein LOC127860010 isoform X2 [Dreissena polymorpha]|uniref:uncharacterized protein LOC127860010 isoform X2 n=1 Tax=Dreissena polymorpha TaxID=45954 RepID=UPI002264DA07|nr:uncharacterized protein LOC127860010 isoform X2 [Dreissena polymorpha]
MFLVNCIFLVVLLESVSFGQNVVSTSEDVWIKAPENEEARVKRQLTGLDLYHRIADASGGTVYETDKTNIATVVDIIKDSVASKPLVSVLKFAQLSSSNNTFEIPVDDLVRNLTIKIQSASASLPGIELFKPNGSKETFGDKHFAASSTLGKKLMVITLFTPTPGPWRIRRTSNQELLVEVQAKTDLDFQYKLLTPSMDGYGLYPLTGDNTTIQINVPLAENVTSVDQVILVDKNGAMLSHSPLVLVGGSKAGKTLLKSNIIIPSTDFRLAIEGRDKHGHVFRRLNPELITTLAIKLQVLPLSGSLYVNQTISIPYLVGSPGSGVRVTVNISDDLGFALSPISHSHTLSTNSTQNGTFILRAGPTKGVTCTITISARADRAPANQVQYSILRMIVEEKIVKIMDKTPPTCRVTNLNGKCDIGSDVCACANQTWRMTAEVSDNESGLFSVFPSGAGNGSTFNHTVFSSGHKPADGKIIAYLTADCCHQNAKVTVVDLEGNVDVCYVTITPGFVPPSPKLCALSNSKSTYNTQSPGAIQISCNVTDVTDTCNASLTLNVTYDCASYNWSFVSHLGNDSVGKLSLVPQGAGKDASISLTNNTVNVTTDCCHPDVSVNVIDFAGNIGRCRAVVQTPITTRTTSANRMMNATNQNDAVDKTSVGAIVGGAVGGALCVTGVSVVILLVVKKCSVAKVTDKN